jgi:acetate kinase
LDLGALLYIGEKENLDFKGMNTLINKKAGLAGITGKSSDMRDIGAGIQAGDERCLFAFQCFCYRVKKYIGAYAAAMNGVDLVVMTGGIGENDIHARAEILDNLQFFGIDFDNEANQVRGQDQLISKPNSKTAAMVITTNEELVIATDTLELVR